MSSLKFASVVAMISLVGCGGQQAESAPPSTPPGETEVQSTEPEAAEPEAAEPEAAEPEAAEPAAEPEAAPAAKPEKKGCAGLDKGKCEVSVGCAWSTDKKCIDQ